MTGIGLYKDFDYTKSDTYVFDYDIFDRYVKAGADYSVISEEVFKFLTDRYFIDHRIKRLKDKVSGKIK